MGDNNDAKPPAPPVTQALDISHEIIILAFDLVGKEVKDAPSKLMQLLQDVNLKKEIEGCLNDYAAKLLAQQNTAPKPMTAKDAGNLALKSLQKQGQKIGQEALKNLADQVQGTQEFQDLKEDLEKLKKEFADQPIGVWFTDARVYLIAAGVLLSAGAAVFATYSEVKKIGVPALLSKIEGQSIKMKVFGSLDLEAQLAKVDKTKDVADFKFTGTKDWKPLLFSLEVVGHAKSDLKRMEGVGVNGKITLQVSENVQVEVKGGVDKQDFHKGAVTADIGATLKIKPSKDQPFTVGIMADLKESGRRPEASFGLNIEFSFGGSGQSKYDYLMSKGFDR